MPGSVQILSIKLEELSEKQLTTCAELQVVSQILRLIHCKWLIPLDKEAVGDGVVSKEDSQSENDKENGGTDPKLHFGFEKDVAADANAQIITHIASIVYNEQTVHVIRIEWVHNLQYLMPRTPRHVRSSMPMSNSQCMILKNS